MENMEKEVVLGCPLCGKRNSMPVDMKKYKRYMKGTELIQRVFPELNPVEREFIKTGCCVECQKMLFGSEYSSEKIKPVGMEE